MPNSAVNEERSQTLEKVPGGHTDAPSVSTFSFPFCSVADFLSSLAVSSFYPNLSLFSRRSVVAPGTQV